MCTTCGCGHPDHPHDHHDHDHPHGHDHHHHHHHDHDHPPLGAAHDHGTTASRAVQIEEDILAENNQFAAANRRQLASHHIAAFNLLSSPGAGKTTLLGKTCEQLKMPVGVIEGDQSTDVDTARLKAQGITAIQINTGRGCHLDAHGVGHAMVDLPLHSLENGILFIENVGNLICPAAFDLGESAKVVLLSVTEGEDKPLKYPDIFSIADLVLITKVDLLPHVPFNLEKAIANVKQVNPDTTIHCLSVTSGEGMEGWLTWLKKHSTAA